MVKSILKGTLIAVAMGAMVGCAMAGVVGGAVGGSIGFLLGSTTMTALTLGGALSSRFPQRARRVAFECRHSHRPVEAVVFQNADTSQVFEVDACSAFSPETDVRCKKRCMEDMNTGIVPLTPTS